MFGLYSHHSLNFLYWLLFIFGLYHKLFYYGGKKPQRFFTIFCDDYILLPLRGERSNATQAPLFANTQAKEPTWRLNVPPKG